jgi:CHAT domain-containing protein
LLIAVGNSLQHIPVPVTSSQLDESISGFRTSLADIKTTNYKTSGGQLYKWLIQPMEPLLAQKKIDTLVFVPGGLLRTIPLSALYDSRTNVHLIEQYAVSTVPGLSLTVSTADVINQPPRALCVGVTTATADLPAPRNIAAEMSMVEHAFATPGEKLFDDEFDFGNIFRHVKNNRYSIIHIASETHFESEACHCAIRTSDEKQPLTLDRLEKLGRLHSLELLVLSCAQTRPGDARAAIGLSGLAYNSVVGAAVATLWNSNDPASAPLLLEFYHQLVPEAGSPDQHRQSKAKAMQSAQKKMLKDESEAHRHPFIWAPYLVIGESPMGSGN